MELLTQIIICVIGFVAGMVFGWCIRDKVGENP